MELAESETIILINDGDLKDGFFRFSTTKLTEWTKLLKIVKSMDNLSDIKMTEARGRVTSWQCKIPRSYLSSAGWKIGKKVPKVLSEEEKARLADQLKRGREKKVLDSNLPTR